MLAAERPIADYFEAVVGQGVEPKTAANWVMTEVRRDHNETGEFAVSAEWLADLLAAVKDGTVSNQAAKQVFAAARAPALGRSRSRWKWPVPADDTQGPGRAARVWCRYGDADALGGWVDEVLAANPKEVERYKAGETKLLGFFTGQVMKKSGGKADPKKLGAVLQDKLK